MYNIFGYTDDMQDIDITIDGFVAAVKLWKELEKMYVVFLQREKTPGTCAHVTQYSVLQSKRNTKRSF